jgi:hypothetical protein
MMQGMEGLSEDRRMRKEKTPEPRLIHMGAHEPCKPCIALAKSLRRKQKS